MELSLTAAVSYRSSCPLKKFGETSHLLEAARSTYVDHSARSTWWCSRAALCPPRGPLFWAPGTRSRREPGQGMGDSLILLSPAVLSALDAGSAWQMHSCGCASAKELSVWEIYQWLSK